MERIFVAEAPLGAPASEATGELVDLGGETWYRVTGLDAMPPFFISLANDTDLWLFISSNGALTAGRKDADHALFPYYTDDRIHDSQDQTGSKTLLRILREGRVHLWEPFSQRYEGLYRTTRSLCKSVHGNKILFEEQNLDLALTFRYVWMTSERFGFVRQATLVNHGEAMDGEVLDGIQNVLPWGVDRRFQAEFSSLADGYKRTERVPETPLALFRLSSVPVDKAEPSEALRVNLAWSTGLEPARRLLSAAQLGAFRRGAELTEEVDVRGQRGAFLLNAPLALAPGAERHWLIVADVDQDAVAVHNLMGLLATCADPTAEVLADVDRGTRNLVRLVASADGLQATGDPLSTWRHFANTLFNIMRGGVPEDGYHISRDDFAAFLGQTNREVAARSEAFLAHLPESLPHSELLAQATAREDLDLERLAHEYLPLTFSRRHGDPSRPWNAFSIRLQDERGRRLLNYEGNWRDIFQNWEALGHAFPGYLESMIFKFADSSTVDGHNPYRLLRAGFDWEVIDPQDPWSFIGYWGDHQVIYLLKLMEACQRHHPGTLAHLLHRRVFTYANVPYRIKPYGDLLANPHDTITFDPAAHAAATRRAASLGADGKALWDAQGLVRANLAEKLLLVALTKLTNFIPGAGIWMNTQRPEWNDANNALVGYGVSLVTLCYLRRYLAFLQDLFRSEEVGDLTLSRELADLLEAVHRTLTEHAGLTQGVITDRDRRLVLDALGQAGTRYREQVYAQGFTGIRPPVSAESLQAFCAIALQHLDHAIALNRREDGLYHAYNLMKVGAETLAVRRLHEMLEGQVAVLSSGALCGTEAAAVLDALQASALYREDQGSYVLYPDRPLPHFLEKNTFDEPSVAASSLLSALRQAGDTRIIAQDLQGRFHFNAAFRNANLLRAALKNLTEDAFRDLAARETPQILDLYETVFDHQSFTGRSGTFYKYEGLGCIYWHMVSKLLLAVGELRLAADGRDPALEARLARHYQEIREGLGVHKSPSQHGAIPLDPYSHTPGFAGAQQPGMTGQVKEDILSRFVELGVQVQEGRLVFLPGMVAEAEFLTAPSTFHALGLDGAQHSLPLEPGTLAFTLCQVPVVVHRSGPRSLRITHGDGTTRDQPGLSLDASTSRSLFERTGAVQRLEAFLGM